MSRDLYLFLDETGRAYSPNFAQASNAIWRIALAAASPIGPEKFTPSAGKITAFNTPGGTGVRVDTAAYTEGVIPPYYDSLIAKLITHGKDREEAIARMSRALEMFIVEGIHTTIPLHRRIMENSEFRAAQFDTKFMERFLAEGKELALGKDSRVLSGLPG